ncbi:hypothetical protein L9F63_013180 [Diploptera punctata]|uniref:aralkylamine N-acetyltransferase n=1 Tax=Diploptera punctata TaxID=6984 RepID=A0AAD8ACX1_DIPPU|nr:hypothetical protein L9F63_013180 [Diploptera punctata]
MVKEFEIVIAIENDRKRIVEFLRASFYKHEPLNVVNGTTNGPDSDAIYSLSFLSEGKSLLALSKSGQIIGVCLNGEDTPGMIKNRKDYMSRQTCNSYSRILDFLNKVEHSVDVWKLTGADRALHIHLLAVDLAFGGRGIGRALMERTRDIAQSAKYPLLYVLCSSFFSAKAAEKMGMKCIYSLPYSAYTDDTGKPYITPPFPHTQVKILIQQLL